MKTSSQSRKTASPPSTLQDLPPRAVSRAALPKRADCCGLVLWLVALFFIAGGTTSVRADVPANNLWPNPTFESGDSLDSPAGTPTGWNRGGNNGAICQVSTDNAVSPTHALAVNDTDAAGYGEWYSDLDLTGLIGAGDDLDLHWFEMFNISGGEMRLSLLFFDSGNNVIGQKHFVTTGQSAGWAGTAASSPFVSRQERVPVPDGTLKIRLSLVSGGSPATTGIMVVDDLSVVRHRNPILLANNFWLNPGFELGDNLDQPSGTPTGWNRGGNNPALCQMSTANSVSPTHALAVVDADNTGYAEWYSSLDLTGHATGGDQLDLQWFEIFNTTDDFRLSLLFFAADNSNLGSFHFVVHGQSAGFTGDFATSPFVHRLERVPVFAGAVRMQISLISGGPAAGTGTMLIDDLSVAKVPPQVTAILPGNIRPNPGFEVGVNLDSPTGTPAGWSRGGNDPTICQVSTATAVSATHSLALVDTSASGYGEWYCDQVLPCSAQPGRALDLQWFELYNITGGDMRVTILFFNAANGVVGQTDHIVNGQSAGWTGDLATSPFVQRNQQLVIPAGTTKMRVSFVSGGPASVTGTMLLDNFSVAIAPTTPSVLFGNIWPNPGFEAGTSLDDPIQGLPLNWQRGGSAAGIDVITTTNYTSSTHALAVIDNSAMDYGEWYASVTLAGRANPGDVLSLQWFELFSVSNGEMRLSVLFFDSGNALLDQHHYVAKNQSAGWTGDIACSTFTQRNQQITVPVSAARMQISLVSGGPGATTGVMLIDDLSIAPPAPPPMILPLNLWVNSTFEAGAQLDNPGAGLPAGGWNRGGSDSRICQILHDKATSPTHALAVVDTNGNGYGEWYGDQPLPSGTLGVDLQWFELYDTTGDMRLSVLFFDGTGNVIGQNHHVVHGQSAGWTGDLATSPFVKQNEHLDAPAGSVRLRVSLVSGGGLDVTGTMIIDDLSVRALRLDSDGDGMSDADEALAGTDPYDPTSVLGVSRIAKEQNGFRITWSTVPGKHYTLLFGTALSGADFVPVFGAEDILADGPTASFLDTDDAGATSGFFRIRLLQ